MSNMLQQTWKQTHGDKEGIEWRRMSECEPEWMCQHQPVTGPPLPDLLVDQIWLMVLRDQLINSMFFYFREKCRERLQ